jgi:hypothetical protein
VATKKITITLPEGTLARLRESAAASGIPLSTYIAHITEHHARIQEGLAALREWEAVSGPVSDEDAAWAAREIARVDALTRTAEEQKGDEAPPEVERVAS